MRWLGSITDSMGHEFELGQTERQSRTGRPGMLQVMGSQTVTQRKSDQTS